MKQIFALIASIAAFLLADKSFAQTLFWDGGTANISTSGDGISQGKAGTWDNVTQNWDQGSGLPHTSWISGADAIFGASGGGLVTLADFINANSLTVSASGYAITDGGTGYTLAVNNFTNSATVTISNNIANSSGTFTKYGSGNLILDAASPGLNVNTFVNAGTLQLGDGTANSGNNGPSSIPSFTIASGAILMARHVSSTTVLNPISGQGEVEIQNASGKVTILNDGDTYSGPTVIASGILIVNSVDDVNPSGLGTGPLQIGNNASSATFYYLGASPVTTTRPLILGGNGTSIISGNFNGNVGAAITFAGPFSFGPNITANKVLELTATGIGVDVMACNLFDRASTNLLILNKQAGSWLVTGNNTFSGGVTFSGANNGALYITNDAALGAPTGGIFFTNGSGTLAATNFPVTLGPSRTITITNNTATFSCSDNNNLTVASLIAGSGSVTKGPVSTSLGTVRFSNDANSYTGVFTAGYGNTEFTSLADAGLPSSLGAGSSITIGNATSFAILRYVGATGTATHRPLNWTGTTGSLQLDNTNTGTISYLSTAQMVNGAGSKTLFLQGSNTGANTLAQVINDNGGTTSLTKNGTGKWILTGANTYSGATAVNGGTLLVNGSLPSGAVVVNSGGTLGGTGVIGGPVTVASGGTLAVANPVVGTLTIANSVTNSGTISLKLNKSSGTNDKIVGMSTLVYGGTLSLTNVAGNLAGKDSFQLFSAASYQGAFSAIVPATPGPGLTWNTNNLAVNGTLSITGTQAAPPVLTYFHITGNAATFQGTNGAAGAPFVLWTSTNLALAKSQWTPVLTNAFDTNGNFTVAINIYTLAPQQFFILSQ